MGLALCATDNDVCLQRGLCITSMIPSNISVCICDQCYYGDHCEMETFSKNLWTVGQPAQKPEMTTAIKLFLLFYSITQLINCLLCLQTYFFCRKIRMTNVGVYLIFNSMISLLISCEELVSAILLQFIKHLPDRYWQIQCLIDQKFVLISLTYMWYWSVLFLALERMLIQCFQCSLFDSQKRSLIISSLIFIICPLTTIPGIFTLKDLPTDKTNAQVNQLLIPFSCVNYTPLGYTIYRIISSIHEYGTLLSYIILSVVVFAHLLRHRKRVAPKSTTLQNVRLVLHKHRDFSILLLVPVIFGMPMMVLNEIMTCSKAAHFQALPYLLLVFGCVLGLTPMAFSFFFYVYPADVYMVAFWNESPAGRFLRLFKRKAIQISRKIKNKLMLLARKQSISNLPMTKTVIQYE